ncbi:unnamed protein product [Strongylus vulgaris]|uniref:Uncharacterized protein n=1 Tax=Strongylus vulgaris TaxID=40348 RepID=A0A3P7HYF5_STRVU|nr:unnamed protein product [Strongylus vulgaris]
MFMSLLNDVIEDYEKDDTSRNGIEDVTHVFSPTEQRIIFQISEDTLAVMAILWFMFNVVIMCKLLYLTSVVLLEIEMDEDNE